MTFITPSNQDRAFFTDATVTSFTNTGGSAIALLGEVKSVSINLKRDEKDVTGPADLSKMKRATRWDFGSVEITGFDQITGNKFMSAFAGSATGTFQFQEGSAGDAYQLLCLLGSADVKIGDNPNESSIKMTVMGVPYYGAAGATPTPISLGS